MVTFTAIATHGGLTPTYQWKVNGSIAGTNNAIYSYMPANGDIITCILTSSEACATTNPVTSNQLVMVINQTLPVSIAIAASPNPFCTGASVTFTGTPSNGGTSPFYQWKVNGANAGANASILTYNPAGNDSVQCLLTSNLVCFSGNPAMSNKIIARGVNPPVVTFTACFDTITTVSAKPFKLKGGIPLGGTYSGIGVNSATGIFTPATAGSGTKTITYSFTNIALCSASKTRNIMVQTTAAFTCGNNLTDIRDNKVYPTVLIGSQCWLEENLDFGFEISDLTPQTDNCVAEKYTDHSSFVTRHSSFYQWDELMNYSAISGAQGLCPPGWHIPDLAEWEVLLNQYFGVGMAGGWLKDRWLANGFGSHQQGLFYQNNTWSYSSGIYAGSMYWTSVNISAFRAAARGINDYNPSVSRYDGLKSDAFNVRCIKN
jgi:uncharacterized protein (TIGR02145 family)